MNPTLSPKTLAGQFFEQKFALFIDEKDTPYSGIKILRKYVLNEKIMQII